MDAFISYVYVCVQHILVRTCFERGVANITVHWFVGGGWRGGVGVTACCKRAAGTIFKQICATNRHFAVRPWSGKLFLAWSSLLCLEYSYQLTSILLAEQRRFLLLFRIQRISVRMNVPWRLTVAWWCLSLDYLFVWSLAQLSVVRKPMLDGWFVARMEWPSEASECIC